MLRNSRFQNSIVINIKRIKTKSMSIKQNACSSNLHALSIFIRLTYLTGSQVLSLMFSIVITTEDRRRK